MDIEKFRSICLSMEGVTEEFPFGPNTLVYKIKGKMFALTDLDMFQSINLKCDPEEAIELRERYAAVQPGYHMNKTHWNTILMDNSVSDKLIEQWIVNSYNLVCKKLPKK
jgi:predicted DNA-binding protein (MmcQ/YjbR family)